ncbi:MAG: DUF2452 domain-containing protein [Crocinitomicaceae bacterium]|nr:DUF2452 domain-containing protein [Crocinitomicaceae bacterium]
MSEKEEKKEFINPIDPDKITENPHTLEYGHNVGSAVIKPEDIGKIKGRSLSAMAHQTDQQLGQIYEQMKLLAEQAKKIETRKTISARIYKAEYRFEPIINHTYHLYEDENAQELLSIIGPNQWGRTRKNKYTFLATVKLLADHTWEILELPENPDDESE